MNHPRIAVVGVGGVGGYVGGMLAKSGSDVTLVARPDTVRAISADGLLLRTIDGESVIRNVKAVDSVSKLEAVDVVLLTTKTYDLTGSIADLPSTLRRDAMFVTFQNGIDNDAAVRAVYPELEVYPGVAYIVSAKKASGVIEQSAGPRKFLIGDRRDRDNQKLNDLAATMRDAGIDCAVTQDIEKELWAKFIWILAFAGVTASLRSPIGPIVNDAGTLAMFTRCVDEGISLACACGVNVGHIEREAILAKAEGYKTKGTHARASLALDLLEGRKTEVEALHGTIVKLAHRKQIEIPVIEMMYHTIRVAEWQYREDYATE